MLLVLTWCLQVGNPLDMETQVGAQASLEQYEKIQSYLQIGKDEGAEVIVGGNTAKGVDGGYYIQPTVFKGTNKMRVFQVEHNLAMRLAGVSDDL